VKKQGKGGKESRSLGLASEDIGEYQRLLETE
jgi:hypothetical protein